MFAEECFLVEDVLKAIKSVKKHRLKISADDD
jgi:hypothetical protein